jgi:amidase
LNHLQYLKGEIVTKTWGSLVLMLAVSLILGLDPAAHGTPANTGSAGGHTFHLGEATIDDIHDAIRSHEITCVELVQLYLKRIKAYNGTCVSEPNGLLGQITTIPNAGQLNAYQTINLRPANRILWGFDQHHARSLTDLADDDPSMPDALETAAALDAQFARTHQMGPLFCVPMAIKDMYDTVEMRTTDGADAPYANDRPLKDALHIPRLRAAGAVLLGKTNMSEYATTSDRSSFGGVTCNPYDTERTAGASSSGSAAAVSANMALCAMAEESGTSIRNPSSNNSTVGLAPTQELVPRTGMVQASIMNDRVGLICRTVKDVAKIMDVIAGYDPSDPLTAFGKGQLPEHPYADYGDLDNDKGLPLKGVRIGVVREYMVAWTDTDAQSITIVEQAIDKLKALGADVVDPGPGNDLFRDVIAQLFPYVEPAILPISYPALFTGIDQIDELLNLFFDPGLFPSDVDALNIRSLGPSTTTGEAKYVLNRYLRNRGDTNIESITDLINKSNFWNDPFMRTPPLPGLVTNNSATTLSTINRMSRRFALQQLVRQKLAAEGLDMVVYPTHTVPAHKLTNPVEPTVHGRNPLCFTVLPGNGFPALSVPAGFTTVMYDRVRTSPTDTVGVLTPVPAKLPVSIDFLGVPFSEPALIHVGAIYETATHQRVPPPAFGPLPGEP